MERWRQRTGFDHFASRASMLFASRIAKSGNAQNGRVGTLSNRVAGSVPGKACNRVGELGGAFVGHHL